CFLCIKAHAQLGFCEGNSGDPIFIETFGTGTTSTALPPGTTTYTFASFDPQDGFYTVSNTTGYFDWHNTSDHTVGDVNGKSLIVNADFTAGEFYKTTINGLCENTSYEFSSWVLNLLPPNGCGGNGIPINVRFEIWDITDTNLLASGDTGNISGTTTPNWQQYGLVFQTVPSQTAVILKMINNGAGGCGNDLAIDDIVFKTCGDFISISDPSNNSGISICSSQTPYNTTITALPDNSIFTSHFYQWQESTDNSIWVDIVGEINAELILNGITSSMFYRAKVAESATNLNDEDCITFSNVFPVTVIQAPIEPVVECWEFATFNDTTCTWDITGTMPEEPSVECWETTTFNNTTCNWDITGTQPEEPTNLECWEIATFNDTTCSWDITGTQPEEPSIECWETTTFNHTTCSWDITGTQPEEPTNLACWETALFNNVTCSWEISGSPPEEPSLECWETSIFNTINCAWEVSGTQPEEPTNLACWETALFNNVICSWEITGTQPEEPNDLECWQTTLFNDTSCEWEITGLEPIEFIEENLSFCEGEELTLSGNIGIIDPSYLWDSGEITEEIVVTDPGTYVVEISNNTCFTTVKTIHVIQNESPIIESVISDGSAIIITAANIGEFEYSLDGIQYQLSNIFYGVQGGFYNVYVRDIHGCGLSTTVHLHFVIPKFFTPNNDGINDVFALRGIEYYDKSEVYLFDRYGKLIKSSRNQPFIWDGTFNNQSLPTSDYWYIIRINDQEFKGHFSLKR
ncbi:MAG: T9SS type B sorting domain-containing protein, partial [Flavobacteriaceae bacterium]|nr:T9SS type B sorting domain-containing protein [Flavobacteriaceae bacterium]